MTTSTRVIETLQARLRDLGYYSNDLTDEADSATQAAVTAFKAAHGFVARPYVGPLTLALLFSDGARPAKVTEATGGRPPWFDELHAHYGLHERTDNRELRAWLASDGATLGDPAVYPWCGDAVQTAVANTLPDEPLPANPYLAANWTKFGKPYEAGVGAVLVFWRGSPTSVYGHVGLYAGEDSTAFHVLGGNQSDAITLTRIAKDRLRKGGMRWPATTDLVPGGPVRLSTAGKPLSTNEA